jgi:hypothetical protein
MASPVVSLTSNVPIRNCTTSAPSWINNDPAVKECDATKLHSETSAGLKKILLVVTYYLLLIATTGFILAAMEAGMMPDKTPSTTHIVKARIIILPAITIVKGRMPLKIAASP